MVDYKMVRHQCKKMYLNGIHGLPLNRLNVSAWKHLHIIRKVRFNKYIAKQGLHKHPNK